MNTLQTQHGLHIEVAGEGAPLGVTASEASSR